MSDRKVEITPREDGPLVVKGLDSLRLQDGTALEVKPVVALCRCGHSKNKPYCDGSHKTAGFRSLNDHPAQGVDRVLRYAGAEVTVTFNPRLCAHAAECARLAGHVFNANEKPWIQPDKGTRTEIEAAVRACPSGALAFEGPTHLLPERATITVETDGPYWVLRTQIDAPPPGEAAAAEKFALCRCGLSGNKPYCDGSHRSAKWKAE
jgi:CDGSH-type Zn-finger protein